MILKVLKIARAFRRVQFENFHNHECLLFTNCTRRSCDFFFIVHSSKLRRFHGNLIGTPTENTRAKRLRVRKLSTFKLAVANANFKTRMPVFELKSNLISIQNFKAGNVKPPGMHWNKDF